MRETTFIYALRDPRSGNVFYVGKSNNPKGRYYSNWSKEVEDRIARIEREGISCFPEIVEKVHANSWFESEKKWIAYFKAEGARLLNKNHGGGGVLEHTEAHKRRLSKILKGRKKPPFSKEHRRRLSEAHKGQVVSEARRNSVIRVHTGKHVRKDTRRKLSLLAIRRWASPSYRRTAQSAMRRAGFNRRLLDGEDVKEIKVLRQMGKPIWSVAEEFGCSPAMISGVCTGHLQR